LVDCRRRRLLFLLEWLPDPGWWKRANIPLDYVPKNDQTNPIVAEDIRRREELIEREDKRRRDRWAALVKRT
jgi:hypothetical protein